MAFAEESVRQFAGELASGTPVPGGGGASALVGAVGAALASMVGNLTVGKKKYADVESDVRAAMKKAEEIRAELLRLMDEDAKAFAPLAQAYGIPRDNLERPAIMERALVAAAVVPLETMRAICRAIELHAELAEKGSRMAISDVGVGAVCCKAALKSASLNVFINTASMADREYAKHLEVEADAMLKVYCTMAEETYRKVFRVLRSRD